MVRINLFPMNYSFKLPFAAALSLGFFVSAAAQETPVAEAVYGGMTRDFAIAADNGTTTVPTVTMFMATESANSVFYQTGSRVTSTDPSSPGVATFSGWQVMPTLDENAEYGSNIDGLACHGASSTLLFLHEGTLYSTTPTATTNAELDGPGVQDVLVIGDDVLYVRNGMAASDLDLVRGEMDASGTYAEVDVLTFSTSTMGDRPKLVLDEYTDELFVTFPRQTQMVVMTFGDTYDNITSTTTVSSLLNPSPNDPLVEWAAFDVAPDGRWYVMGNSSYELAGTGHDRQVAYSYDNGFTWDQFDLNAPGPAGGVYGNDIVFIEHDGSSQFSVLSGDVVSHAYGISGTWTDIGHLAMDGDTRANSGFVCVDPIFDQMVYFTTNQGSGYSMDRGETTNNMCEGMLAIQVNDIDMTDDKQNAWVASKSGVRRVTDYLLPTKAWSDAIWPNLDGSPYKCMEILDDNAETVIAGNTRLHMLEASGSWSTVFDPSVAFGSAFHYGTKFMSVEQSPTNSNLIYAGAIQEGTLKGGLFVSVDGGTTFQQLELNAAATPAQDEDVLDIEFVQEGSTEVAYVALSYADGGAGNVFRVVHDASTGSFSVSYNFHAANCNFTGNNTNTITDLQLSEDGTMLFAAGQDLTTGAPALFSKDMDGASQWELMDMSVLPLSDYDNGISALAFGNNRVFIAMDEEIYYYDFDNAAWALGYSYPEGTQINVMYYDELLVGTGTGLYAHGVFQSTSIVTEAPVAALSLEAFPNPTTGQCTVRLGEEARGEVSVLDMAGRVMFTTRVTGPQVRFDMSELTSGNYLVRWTNEADQTAGTTQVVKH